MACRCKVRPKKDPSLQTLFTSKTYEDEQDPQNDEEGGFHPEDEEQYDADRYNAYVKQMLDELGYDYEQWIRDGRPDLDEWLAKQRDAEDDIDYSPLDQPPPVEEALMGMKSFNYLDTRILANFIQNSEDERMEMIKARLCCMKEVPPPKDSISVLHQNPFQESTSKEEMEPEIGTFMKNYQQTDWSVKRAKSFLQKKAGCRDAEPLEEVSSHLKMFQKKPLKDSGERRRFGEDDEDSIPDGPFKRRAERTAWRFLIGHEQPKYPLPRFILPRYQNKKKYEKAGLGPGTYEIGDYYEQQRLKGLRGRSLWDSCTTRFGREGAKGNPVAAYINDAYSVWEKACDHKRHPGKVPLFQSTPCNFRYKNFYIGCGLGPGHYNIKSPRLECCKTVGLLTSGSGGATFCPDTCGICPRPSRSNPSLGPGYYNVLHSVKDFQESRCHKHKGHFAKAPREKMVGFRACYDHPLWPEDKGFPGPATYQPYESEEWTENAWAAFNVGSTGRKLDDLETNKLLAPDFYHYTEDRTLPDRKDILGDGFKSNFVSKSPMTTLESRYAALKERTKATNVKFDQEPKKKRECEGEGKGPV